jgi:uncharacterized protein (TIGR03435 family)
VRHNTIRIVVSGFVIVTSVVRLSSQVSPQQKSSFDVISIKVNKSANRNSSIGAAGGRFNGTNVTLRALLKYAYRSRASDLMDSQLIGGPAWADTDRFDVEARSESDGGAIQVEEMQQRVQSLLAGRFQVQIHREMRTMPVYNLVVVKKGKLKVAQDQSSEVQAPASRQPNATTPPPRGAARMLTGRSGSVLAATAIEISKLAGSLQVQLDRPILDKTGLSGLYDIHLEFGSEDISSSGRQPPPGAPQPAAVDTPAPSLFTALENQLGLKLRAAKGPVPVIVIDHAEKPSEN